MAMQRKTTVMIALTSILMFCSWLTYTDALAASASSAVLKAKQEAEAKGYIFLTSRDEIVERAKKEGKLDVLAGQQSIKGVANAFRQKYPFIDVRAEEPVGGLESKQRILHEIKGGLVTGWDVDHVAYDYYNEYLPYQKKFDILGMAQHGVLRMSPQLVDPVNRNIVALQSNIQVVAYNKTLISADRVPAIWEDFLKPEFKDRKFVVDVRGKPLAALVPAWGLEKTLEFSKMLAAQKPIWLRGDTRAITYLLAGELALLFGPNYSSFVQAKDAKAILGHKVMDPVPTRLTQTQGILTTAKNPYAALLWLEFNAGPEGQKILDEIDLAASIYTPGSFHERLIRGKKASVLAWGHYQKMDDYEKKIVEALGFPRAENK